MSIVFLIASVFLVAGGKKTETESSESDMTKLLLAIFLIL